MTVETAFVLPLFLFALLVMLGLFQALQVQTCMSQALQYSARQMAGTYGPEEGSREASDLEGTGQGAVGQGDRLLSLAAGRAMTMTYFQEHGGWKNSIVGGAAGVSFAASDLSGDYVSLCASYRVRLPISFWRLKNLPVSQCVRARKWIGKSDESGTAGDGGYVYVTKYGTAYHKSLACPYLDLSIHAVSAADVGQLRSKDGSRYYACSCYKKGGGAAVYITDYGNRYHASLSCSDLSRTVYRVKMSESGGRHACPKCAR